MQGIKQKLEQYTAAKAAIELIDADLRRGVMVTDSVMGSMTVHPYTMRRITIEGVDRSLMDLLQAKKAELARLRLEVEGFLAGVPDSHIASIIRLRYFEEKTWQGVAMTLGGKNKSSGVRMALYRYLREE